MQARGAATGRWRWLLILGIISIVLGAGLMDEAGRTQQALWWNISGAFAFLGFALAALYLILQEGPGFLAGLAKHAPRSRRRHHRA